MSLLSVENDIVKGLICNRELQKKDQVEKLSSKGQENFIAISKSWSNVKVPIKDKHSTWTLVPEQIKNLEKTIPFAGHGFLQNGIQKGVMNITIE